MVIIIAIYLQYIRLITQLHAASTVAVTNSFPGGAFPEQSLNCEQPANGPMRCSLVETQCVSALWSLVRTTKIYAMNVLGLVHCLHCLLLSEGIKKRRLSFWPKASSIS